MAALVVPFIRVTNGHITNVAPRDHLSEMTVAVTKEPAVNRMNGDNV